MKTVDRHHEVFVSSTYVDLKDERQAVLQTLLRMNCLPVGMELFPNGRPDVWQLIEDLISRCDVYILILAGRSGTLAPDGSMSFTEKEFRLAQSLGKPMLIYPHLRPSEHNPAACADETDLQRSRLEAFHNLVKKSSTRPWLDVAELRANVAIDLATMLPHVAASWTRSQLGLTEIFGDELKALSQRFESPDLQALTKLLRTTLQQFAFVHSRDRLMRLGSILPWLSEKEWTALMDFGRAQALLRSEGYGALSEPMKKSVVDMVEHYQAQLTNFESGTLQVEGELMNSVAAHFFTATTQTFRALSNEDIEFWASPESKAYYENNVSLIERNVAVERTFVVPREEFRSADFRKVVTRQLEIRVGVRIIASEDIERIVPARLDRDFGLHDAFAVSFFRNFYGRSYRIESAPETVSRFVKRYKVVAAHAEVVRDQPSDGDRRLLKDVNDFDAWCRRVDLL